MRIAGFLFLSAVITSLAGCGPSGPKTYPVSGKVVMDKPDSQKLLDGQGIEFMSETEPTTRAFGQLKADGSFTVTTLRLGLTAAGAIEGKHKARLQINMGEDDDGRPRKKKWLINRKFTQFETSGWEITVPVSGEVILKGQ
jgi:hypothetical protein